MSGADQNARQQFDAGAKALHEGHPQRAREHFERALSLGKADASTWHALALACRALGDTPGMLSALNTALRIDGHFIPALSVMGDHYASLNDDRAAMSFYGVIAAIGDAAPSMPAELAAMVRRAQLKKQELAARMSSHLLRHIEAAGYDKQRSSARFTHALDLLTGARRVYLQEPRAFYFPELPNIQFFPRAMFPWLEQVEAKTDQIAAELQAILQSASEFEPYLKRAADRPAGDPLGLADSLDWSAFFLWRDGEPVAENARRCPQTMAALEAVPLCRIKGRAPSILFSRLLPGARIPPHHGFLNTRLICHLPLIVPPGCLFRVGNETREWRRGEAWVFDDSIEHEAYNPSDKERIVLIFEVWRPELTDEERTLVAGLLEGVDAYAGAAKAKWED